MSPRIALLLCILFVLYLFKMDYRRKSNVSAALWIPLLWVMITGSRMVVYWLAPETASTSTDAYLEGNPFDRLIFFGLIASGLVVLLRRRIEWSQLVSRNTWLFLFLLYCGVSILWSDYPIVSLKRWVKEIGNVIMVLVLLSERQPVEAMSTLIRRCAYVLLPFSIILYKYFSALGRIYNRWSGELMITGVTTNKNSLGVLCMICALFLSWNLLRILKNKKQQIDKNEVSVHILMLSMALWLLNASNSATSQLCFIAGLSILLLMRLPAIKRQVGRLGVYIVLVAMVFLTCQMLFNISDIIISGLGRDTTLTGRTELWEELLTMVKHPVFGTGYDSFWLGDRMDKLSEEYWWHPTEAHNGYLETYLELGLVGLFLLTAVIFSTYMNISREFKSDFEYGTLRLTFFVLILLYNWTESSFKGIQLLWFIFLLIAVRYPRLSTSQIEQKTVIERDMALKTVY